MTNVNTDLTNKEVTTLYNMVNHQLTVLSMTDEKYFLTESYKNLEALKEKLSLLNLEIYK